jgi:hypothetical protein
MKITYKDFIKELTGNYFIGSLLAVIGVGASFIFSTLHLVKNDWFIMILILISSMIIMFAAEGLHFMVILNRLRMLSICLF